VVPYHVPQLFLDDERIETKENLQRVWHGLTKHPGNPILTRSGLEGNLFLFGTVIQDTDPSFGADTVFRMWYYAGDQGSHWIGYARSRDGLRWEKPRLNLLEINGRPGRNAVFGPEGFRLIGLSGVVRDGKAGEERYKLMTPARVLGTEDTKTYLMATSPDGINWSLKKTFTPTWPSYPDRACFVWDPYLQAYCLYTRARYNPPELVERGGPAYFGRAIALCRSEDFETWTEPGMVMHAGEDDAPGTELYGMSAFPHGGQWVGLVQIHRSLPELAYLDVAVAHSRDGFAWKRERDMVLPRGGIGEWDRFNQCASTRPLVVGDEIWVYYSGRTYRHGEYGRHTELKDTGPVWVGIGLAKIRLDGWCSMQASFDGGHLLTNPLILPESGAMTVNAKATWGEISVQAIPVGGGASISAEPLKGNGVSLPLSWPDGDPFSFFGTPLRLRFDIRNALLFSWMVIPPEGPGRGEED
jgi:hypothetical protein